MKCRNGKCPPPKKVFLKPSISISQSFPDLRVRTGKSKYGGKDVSNKAKTTHTHQYTINGTVYFNIVANGGEVFTVSNLSSSILSVAQLTAIFAFFDANPTMNNINGYTFDLQEVLLYIVNEGFETSVDDLIIRYKFTYQKLKSATKSIKVYKPNVDDDYDVSNTLESVFIDKTNWLPLDGQTLNVEDYPLLWIKGEYFDDFKGNTFDIANSINNLVYAGNNDDYENVVNIYISEKDLHTNLTNTFFLKFVNLTDFRCYGNFITTIETSNLTNLNSLICADNSITTLNTSNLTNLTYLACYGNDLTTLEVSNLTSLTYLHCADNSIITLKVASLINLQTLSCGNNSIATLDVLNLTNLTYLGCYGNDLTTLEVSNLTSLTRLYCYGNEITVLDVSNLTSLTDLLCDNNEITTLDVTNLTNLTNLGCGNNSITTLDVLNLTSLTRLYCYGNGITTLDVSNLNEIVYLHCGDNSITTLDVSNLNELVYLRSYGNLLSNVLNSQLLIDLDQNLNVNGYFESSIFGGGGLTPSGQTALDNLLIKLWTIVGL